MANQTDETTQNNYLTYDQVNIIIAFQKLWLDLASWMRTYIKAAIYDTRNLQSVKNYLLYLPTEFYNTFNIFYGTVAAQRLMNIMTEFITSAMKVVEAIKFGDSVLTDSRIIEWYGVADKLSSFLARTNVYWDENQWKYLLYQYIKLKINEINAITNDNYEEEILNYNSIEDIIFLIASYMARGIISSNLQVKNNQ
ncbi:hypothetical protein [Anaerovorax sp. IOR16]|uniref:hypothetical protein n=1 Tax=Anaerovorax sp. IOR16 TaxID=2773458 RepID=UPI0019D1B08E|nr:hypothetical protein [Anaerovorax sp. IOR16]